MHCSVLTREHTSTYSGEWGECPGGGGTWPIFTYGWAAEGLKPWPCLGQKNPKIHVLFGTTLEDKGKNASRFCFKAILILATVVEQIHEKSHCFVYLDHEQNSSSKSDQSVQAIPCLGQTHTRLYTLFRTERSKTIPCPQCPAAHPLMGYNYNEVPPGGGCVVSSNPVQQTL